MIPTEPDSRVRSSTFWRLRMMRRHRDYQLMLACQDARSAGDARALAKHLTRCDDCRLRAAGYAKQSEVIRSMPRERPSPRVRQAVLAAWHERDAFASRPRRRLTVRIGLAAIVAAAVLGAASANTPIPGAIAGALGIGSAPTGTVNGVQCNVDGAALLHHATILKVPSDYNPGPHGIYNRATGQEMAAKLLHPTWYVMSDNGGGISSAACKNVSTEDTEIGFNPDSHTQLHVWGVLRNPSNP